MNVPIVDLHQIFFQWGNAAQSALEIDRLSIIKGEKVFIQGPSGCGKTTLLNLMAGVVAPLSGTIDVLGIEISNLENSKRDSFRADHIGFVFQMFNLVPYLTLVENVELPCSFSEKRKSQAEKAGASVKDEATRLLQRLGLEFELESSKSVTELSVGQQQRVAVARALIGRPELIICDEPTSALDADSREVFLDLLFQEVSETDATLVFVSHDTALADGFDREVSLPSINRRSA